MQDLESRGWDVDLLSALNHHCIVVITDLMGNILDFNDRFCEVSGYSRNELLGKNHRIVKSDYHDATFFEGLWHTISSGKVWHGDICNRSKDGRHYWINSTIVPVLNEDGEPYGYISIRTEVTEKKQAELSLHKRFKDYQDKQKTLLQLLSDKSLFTGELDQALEHLLTVAATAINVDRLSIWGAVDDNGVSISLKNYDVRNKTFEKGYPITRKKTLTGQWEAEAFDLLVIPDMKKLEFSRNFTDDYFKKFDIGAVLAAPVFIGGSRQGRVVAETLSEPNEWDMAEQQFIFAISGIVSLMFETNHQKKISDELAESQRRLSDSQKFARIGTWEREIGSDNVRWSDQVSALFGFEAPVENILYKDFLSLVHREDRERIESAANNCIYHGNEYDVEYRIVFKDGSTHWLHVTGNVERDSKGSPIRMLGVVRDITMQHQFEAALIEAREEAEAASSAKSEFLSHMSHELRTPLNAILGFSQLLRLNIENNLTKDQIDNLDEINGAGKHLLNLINEVLDLAKIESRQESLQLEPVSLKQIMAESLILVSPLLEKRNMTIFKVEEEMPDVFVLADRTRLKQVIVNLLTNAAKYAKDNAVVEIGFKKPAANKATCFVKDNGPGIAADKQKKLFQAFSRLDFKNSNIEGTGIGLVISKNLIEQMQGAMGVDSEVGRGSCFWFELEQTSAPDRSQTGNKDESAATNPSVIPSAKKQYDVLYVEDNPANVRLVERIFGQLPAATLISTDRAQHGLKVASQNTFDLVLLDINLPEMNGYQMLEKMKQIPSLSKVPVIAVSANAMHEDTEKMRQAGFDDIITKPFVIADFIAKVKKQLEIDA